MRSTVQIYSARVFAAIAVAALVSGSRMAYAQDSHSTEFIFQIGSTLTTASSSSVTMINGGEGCHIDWQVGSSATLGVSTILLAA